MKIFKTKKYNYTFILNNMYSNKENFLVFILPCIGIDYYKGTKSSFKYLCSIDFRFIVWTFRIIITKYKNKKL